MGLSNYVPNSRISQAGVCTSTTRPATPYEGQVIYETDTNRVLVWDASAWVMIADTDQPPGLQLIGSITATSGTALDYNNCFSSAFDNYKVFVEAQLSGAAGIRLQLYSGSTLLTSGYYYSASYAVYGAVPSNTMYGGVNVGEIDYGHVADSSTVSGGIVELMGPFLPRITTVIGRGTDPRTVGGAGFRSSTGMHAGNNSCTGFRLNFVNSVIYAKATVYGYRN